MIVGWRVASHMRTEMVLDALEMARWSRGTQLTVLRCHSDAGSQFTSVRYGERLAETCAVPSIGTVGDSFDNALAETVNGYYKAELIRGPARPGPWRTVDDVELAILCWVHWHNTTRLHGYLDDLPPIEFERRFTLSRRAIRPWLKPNDQSLHQTQCWSLLPNTCGDQRLAGGIENQHSGRGYASHTECLSARCL
jgi:transposase InsO family protein